MLKTTVKNLWLYFKKSLHMLWKGVSHAAVSWPKAFAAAVALLILSYYPLGGYLSENIDKTTDYSLTRESEQQSLMIETMVFLINREVNENLWMANLPMFFPSYFLDNMPNYQKGIISSLAVVTSVIAGQTQCSDDVKEKTLITDAAKLLHYPPDIWLFAPDNNLQIAPSSATQYRKARKMLRDYNHLIPDSDCLWYRGKTDLEDLIVSITRDLKKSAEHMETQILEHSSDFTDTKADDVFYYNQGKVYAYMLLLKAAAVDFKQILLESNQYGDWTDAVDALENGVLLSPAIVRNGELDDTFAANHLAVLGYYMMRAVNLLEEIEDKIKGVSL